MYLFNLLCYNRYFGGNMANKIFPFSVPASDPDGLELIQKLKKQSENTGVSFSHLVMKALKAKYNDNLRN